MERKEDLTKYGQDLIQALWDQAYRRQTESPDSFQLFASNQSIGVLECEPLTKTEKNFQIKQSLGLLELRSPSGLLIGSVLPDPSKRSTIQFQSGNYVVELDIQPLGDTKSIHMSSSNRLAATTDSSVNETNTQPPIVETRETTGVWSKLALAAQILLLAGVVFLVADRLLQPPWPSGEQGQQVASSQDQQLQQVLQQLTKLQNRLDQSPVMSVSHDEQRTRPESETQVVSHVNQQGQPDDESLLEKKAETFEDGLLESRPVWVRFKKGIDNSRMENFFNEVSAQEPYSMGGWYSFNLGMPKSGKFEDLLTPLRDMGDIEVVTTSVVTRRMQVRFKKDAADEMIDGFFQEIRVDKSEPKDSWYNLKLPLPESVKPQMFIGELKSGKIVEKVKVLDDTLPRM